MEHGWLISHIALWCVTGALVVVVLVHSRLLGILHYRLGPASAKPLEDGPEIGSTLNEIEGARPNGSRWTWSFPSGKEVLLVFISPQCQTCDEMMPHVRDFARTHREVQLVLASTLADAGMNRAFIAYRRLEALTYVIAAGLEELLKVQGTPYAIRIDTNGHIRAKGLVNNYEHLRSLARTDMMAPVPENANQNGEYNDEDSSVSTEAR